MASDCPSCCLHACSHRQHSNNSDSRRPEVPGSQPSKLFAQGPGFLQVSGENLLTNTREPIYLSILFYFIKIMEILPCHLALYFLLYQDFRT